MPITPLSGSGGESEVWGDFSGGIIQYAFIHPTYTSLHEQRVGAFDAGTGAFADTSGSKMDTVQHEADNLATLIAALYAADTTISASQLFQTLTDHSGVVPTAFAFLSSSTVAGSAGGASLPVPTVENFNSRGADGSRWRLTLPGESNAINPGFAGKTRWSALGAGAVKNLVDYLTGTTNGPVHALKTQTVTHNGVPVSRSAGSSTTIDNKRLRRRFGLV